jgi:hypothetical protein
MPPELTESNSQQIPSELHAVGAQQMPSEPMRPDSQQTPFELLVPMGQQMPLDSWVPSRQQRLMEGSAQKYRWLTTRVEQHVVPQRMPPVKQIVLRVSFTSAMTLPTR